MRERSGRAPTALNLLKGLLGEGERTWPVERYLDALGWWGVGGVTARGEFLRERWKVEGARTARGWSDWMVDAGRDVRALPWMGRAVECLRQEGAMKDEALVRKVGMNPTRVEFLMRLAASFGVVVRDQALGNVWVDEGVMWEDEIARAWRELSQSSPSKNAGVSVVDLWKKLNEGGRACGLPIFRRILWGWHDEKRIIAVRSTSEKVELRVSALVFQKGVGVKKLNVDLGRGDFLIPRYLMRALVMLDAKRGKS